MKYQQLSGDGAGYIVRVESGEPVIDVLTAFMKARQVGFATIAAIGAFSHAEVGWWNSQTREYEFHDVDEQVEVLSLQGNCAIMDGEQFLHLHCMLGRHDLSVIGGHLRAATAYPMLEVWVRSQDAPVRRASENGVNALQLG